MLTHIQVRDYTIIDELDIALDPGMSAMTGETGAGKSILVDALGLALGDRADSGVIRIGADTAEISLHFDISNAGEAHAWLVEQGLDDEHDCIIRRTLNREGSSKAFINNRPAPLRSLKELGELLVDIHGQHQHQSLVKRDIQRQLLDDYGGAQTLSSQVNKIYREWKDTQDKFEQLRKASEESSARLELLRFQVQELEQLQLAENEINDLSQEHDRLANAGQLLEACQNAINVLYENDDSNVHQSLNRVIADLEPLCVIDASLANANSLVNNALIHAKEAADELRTYLDRVELDPARLNYVSERLGTIHDLARKHRVVPDELPCLLLKLQQELESIANADEHLEGLQQRIDALLKDYDKQALALRQQRQKAAKELNHIVTKLIHDLGMPHALFSINLEPLSDNGRGAYGIDVIEYLVCTNPGQELNPLSKVASGGELSRISLAIQVALAQTTRINTLVYDEVDTGIGGPTAEIVGRLLRTLGKNRQVLCVTHLPQVAAQAHNHLQVKKQTNKKSTSTGIEILDEKARIEEIARMLGGVKLTDQSRAHAKEMLKGARD